MSLSDSLAGSNMALASLGPPVAAGRRETKPMQPIGRQTKGAAGSSVAASRVCRLCSDAVANGPSASELDWAKLFLVTADGQFLGVNLLELTANKFCRLGLNCNMTRWLQPLAPPFKAEFLESDALRGIQAQGKRNKFTDTFTPKTRWVHGPSLGIARDKNPQSNRRRSPRELSSSSAGSRPSCAARARLGQASRQRLLSAAGTRG